MYTLSFFLNGILWIASAPPWMQALGIGIGCFIPVVGRIMYVRSKTESVPD